MLDFPRISFGMIVLNGEPFIRYNLRALYTYAYEIIVVEGAVESAAAIATPDGHSTDGTLATLRQFKAEEDPDDKLTIVTRDGFWSEKDEMSQAYAARVTGDYLWQVDADEFYLPEAIQKVIDMLKAEVSISQITFNQTTFWGSPAYRVDGWFPGRSKWCCHRLFKWGPGYTYVTHRPPTVYDEQGRDLRTLNWLDGRQTQAAGIVMLHYSLLLPKQVREKAIYYQNAAWAKRERMQWWVTDCFFGLKHPFYVHNAYDYPSWLERYTGKHPPQVKAMWHELQESDYELRQTEDVERLLTAWWYPLARLWSKLWNYPSRLLMEPVIKPILRYIIPKRLWLQLKRFVRP